MTHRYKSITLLLLVSVVSLFFFPLSFGSFQSTHGPTVSPNALQNDNAGFIFAAALLPVAAAEILPALTAEFAPSSDDSMEPDAAANVFAILRC